MSAGDRRQLSFNDFEELLADIDRLVANGYRHVGKWNLGQICRHLDDWMTYPMDGFPKAPLLVRCILAVLRGTIGKSQFRKILASGSMPAGGPTMPATVHQVEGDQSIAVEAFRKTVHRMRNFEGPVHPSPLFGPMDIQSAKKLQLIHCAHHLSFLIPK